MWNLGIGEMRKALKWLSFKKRKEKKKEKERRKEKRKPQSVSGDGDRRRLRNSCQLEIRYRAT